MMSINYYEVNKRNLRKFESRKRLQLLVQHGLNCYFQFFLKNPELKASSEITEIKIHLLNVSPIQFHLTNSDR